MLTSFDQLQGGETYNLPPELANLLIWKGKATQLDSAVTFEAPEVKPEETKIVEPAVKPRKKAKRA